MGGSTPVGITRVEHYVVEYILVKATNPILFICYDKDSDLYRPTTLAEASWITQHALFRYKTGGAKPIEEKTDETTAARIVGKIRKYSAQDTKKFAAGLSYLFEDRLAVPKDSPALSRVLLRILQAVAYRTLLMIHLVIRILVRSTSLIGRSSSSGGWVKKRKEFKWQQGDSLVVLANLWDYMNYEYFHTLKSVHNINITALVYDVIALIYPYTTPEPTDLYRRHWLEIAHTCKHILAISYHTAETYEKYILKPNDLKATVSVAILPNFLKDRAGDIGVQSVMELVGKSFVVYCSTIESRKNHETLIHVWERLIDDIEPACVPVLVFVGRWGWGYENVQRMYERCLQLRPKLLVLERVADDQLIWLYKHAMFSVFPSLSEGFGLAAAESLSFGTPVIVSSCPALREATEGLMPSIDPLDVPEWTRQIRQLFLDKELLTSLRQRTAEFHGADYDAFARTVLHAVISN
jgi:glycosyltransferase involved in cell wall biosynthesis